ncbi:hypothetical protein [Erythrobacter sp.]|uniref:hypothetical protein n=1 Tax=Erythrobacter sp. TaxID=1042 RepID=UPI0025D275B1|nr:hypothetical protein [Erythrobacter sp.]
MMRRIRCWRSALGGAAGIAASLAAPLAAATDVPKIDAAAERAAIGVYQDADQRLQDIGWTLARGNVGFCPRVVPSIGLQLQDMASYGAPAIARAALGLMGDFAVQTAARGSPAALSGAFARNREIVRLERFDPNQWPTTTPAMNWHRLVWAHDHIEAMLTEHGGIAIGFADGEEARVTPVEVCATRFELMGDGGKAVADGTRVVIGIDFPAFAYPEEDVFAALVAHELAHNFLEHDAWLDRNRRTRRHVRRTEREADRLMPWLLANAGYDPAAAVTFMTRWGSRHDAGILMIRDHDGWDERAEFIEGELPLVAERMASEGRADWRTHFAREIDPAKGLETAQAE